MVEVGSAQKPVEVLSSPSHPQHLCREKLAFWPPLTSPSTPLSSPRVSPRAAFTAQVVGPDRGWRRNSPRLPRPVQRTQSVPAGRPARRRPSAGPRPRPKGSLQAGPAPRGRPWTGASASLPREAVGALAAPDGPAKRQRPGAGHPPTRGQGEVYNSGLHRVGRQDWKD